MTSSVIVLASGSASRFNGNKNKVLERINNIPLFYFSLKKFIDLDFNKIILVVKKEEENFFKEYLDSTNELDKVVFAYGKEERFLSVKEGLKIVDTNTCLIHDAARPLVSKDDILNVLNSLNEYDVSFLGKHCIDTLRYIDSFNTLDRSNIINVSTPQGFTNKCYDVILNNTNNITDEVSLFDNSYKIKYIEESFPNIKVTYSSDLNLCEYYLYNNKHSYIGHSLDYHPYSNDGVLKLGGIEFLEYKKLIAHSDGDVLYHSIAEAILGASSLGDLGTFYPDTDNLYKDIDSSIILKDVVDKVNSLGYEISNIDVMLYLIKPNLKDYKRLMIDNIKNITKCDYVCVKAATLNKRGLISLEEGIGSETVVLLRK